MFDACSTAPLNVSDLVVPGGDHDLGHLHLADFVRADERSVRGSGRGNEQARKRDHGRTLAPHPGNGERRRTIGP